MRLQSIVLLVAATLLAAGLVVTDSRTVVTPSFRTSLRNDIPQPHDSYALAPPPMRTKTQEL